MSGRLSNVLPQICMVLFGILILYIIPQQISADPNTTIGPRFFPTLMGVLIIVMSVLSLLSSMISRKKNVPLKKDSLNEEEKNESTFAKQKGYKQVALTVLALSLWTAIMPFLGFAVTTFLLAFYQMYLIGNRNLVKMASISVVVSLVLFAVAKYLLQMSFSTGLFF